MTITPKTIVLALAASAILLFGFSFLSPSPTSSPSSPSLPSFTPQESSAGNVTVIVTPITLKPGSPAAFDVTFETHSVELDFDVEGVAGLTDTQGATYKPAWKGDPPGGHRRRGTLTFPTPLTQATRVTLILKDIAGIPERTFVYSY